ALPGTGTTVAAVRADPCGVRAVGRRDRAPDRGAGPAGQPAGAQAHPVRARSLPRPDLLHAGLADAARPRRLRARSGALAGAAASPADDHQRRRRRPEEHRLNRPETATCPFCGHVAAHLSILTPAPTHIGPETTRFGPDHPFRARPP